MSSGNDADKIRDIARRQKITVWEAGKIYRHYEKSTSWRNCKNCRNSLLVPYAGRSARQCDVIGYCGDRDADLDERFKCDEFKS